MFSFLRSTCVVLLFIAADLLANGIHGLRVESITETTATMRFEINPVRDVEVEIQWNGGTYIKLGNTGEHPAHRYLIQRQIKLKPGTEYWLRLTPVDGPAFSRIKFKTKGTTAEPIAPSEESPGPVPEIILGYETFVDPEKGCEYIRIISSADTDYPRLAQILSGEWTARISEDGVTTSGCHNAGN